MHELLLLMPMYHWSVANDTKTSEVSLSAFIYRLFHEDFSSIVGMNTVAGNDTFFSLLSYKKYLISDQYNLCQDC